MNLNSVKRIAVDKCGIVMIIIEDKQIHKVKFDSHHEVVKEVTTIMNEITRKINSFME